MSEPRRRSSKIRRWLLYGGAVVVLLAGLAYVFDFFPEEQRELRSGIRDAAEQVFPEIAAEAEEAYGMTYLGAGNATAQKPEPHLAAPSVLLIHGLDDPGKVWRDLAPMLIEDGLDVWRIRYPNDQPLLESASFLSDQMRLLKEQGVEEITLVAHSMGGLISREMLTSPEMAYSARVVSGEAPRVNGLVMIATPNHGSELARFRLFGEFREQWINILEGRWQVLSGILDGAGEAKLDLLPGSEFLETLNARTHPENVAMLIIAGDVSPWAGIDFDRAEDYAQGDPLTGVPPSPGQQILADLGAILELMSDGSGDGLVTVKSTRLDGIPHVIVRGTHLTVIRNLLAGSDSVPPAIPLVREFLARVWETE
jgi:pimeloyl-ACP methyl ester carboxylesterase